MFLQLRDDVAERPLAVAAFEDLATGALQFEGAFGEQDHPNFFQLAFGAPTASGGKARLACV